MATPFNPVLHDSHYPSNSFCGSLLHFSSPCFFWCNIELIPTFCAPCQGFSCDSTLHSHILGKGAHTLVLGLLQQPPLTSSPSPRLPCHTGGCESLFGTAAAFLGGWGGGSYSKQECKEMCLQKSRVGGWLGSTWISPRIPLAGSMELAAPSHLSCKMQLGQESFKPSTPSRADSILK